MNGNFAYPATLTIDEEGRFMVSFRDIPWARTDGADRDEAMRLGIDCLATALRELARRGEPIPQPCARRRGDVVIAPDPATVMKLATIKATRGLTTPATTLATRLGIDHKEARRILDPSEQTKAPRLAEALAGLGYVVATTVRARPRPAHRRRPGRAA